MSYLYYPGCSLKGTGRAYEESLLAVFETMDIDVRELNDWNCCGATSYMSVSELKAFGLCARNFALAEKQANETGMTDLIVPCAACYLGLSKAKRYLDQYPDIRKKVDEALATANLAYRNHIRIRHPLDVMVNDIGTERIAAAVKCSLEGLKVACYYGCQIIRPYSEFDDQENPTTMNQIAWALGAKTVDWPLKTRCCGGSLTGTVQDVGQRLSYILLREAILRGADVIITACPLCQFNLECYQNNMSRQFKESIHIPVLYFTQLIGIALGLSSRRLAMQRLFVPFDVKAKLDQVAGGQHVAS
ncbi:MAG: CoB--CoM heterodisulfide reductase iron-sulfur subunit B family protein [candidate division Zixibacteria bacterium]|jgi:heterodisulfide reductase subunit B|nr:CoB--CoM heterodisulfide reductase iron-sulfur subunit B family protein [candidate division Zixibacteria bacterium]